MNAKIFISYATEDASVAEIISAALEALGLEPWVAHLRVAPGDSFVSKIDEALTDAGYVLLLVSRSSCASDWVSREWTSALARGKSVILPVILDTAPVPALLSSTLHVRMAGRMAEGVAELVTFFRREFSGGSPPRRAGAFKISARSPLSRRQLRLVASECVDATLLKAACFDFQLSYESLGGESAHERLLALLHRLTVEADLERFQAWLCAERARCMDAQVARLSQRTDWDLL